MRKSLCLLLSVLVILSSIAFLGTTNVSALQDRSYNFYSVDLTENPASNMAIIAKAQNGRTQGSIGYTEAWCADFVSDCARIAGQTEAIPPNSLVSSLYTAVINAGGYTVGSASTGDLVFYKNPNTGGWMHVGIMIDGNNAISGNYWLYNYSQVAQHGYNSYWDETGARCSAIFVRPNYSNGALPYKTTVSFSVGTNNTPTQIWWDRISNAKSYDVKIWRGEIWQGNPYEIIWDVTDTWCEVNLPAGYYEAYVDSRNEYGINMSNNTIKFSVPNIYMPEKTYVSCSAGTNLKPTCFWWDRVNYTDSFSLKIWKNKIWEGEPYKIIWNITDTWCNVDLEPGNYEAYIDCCNKNGINMSYNVLNFTVEEEKPNIYYSIEPKTNRIKIWWDRIPNVNICDLKIWKDKIWEGDAVKIVWDITEDNYTLSLPPGNYEAYVDYHYNDTLNMSKIIKISVDNTNFIGDVNGDGVISIADATTLQKYLANIVDFDDKQLAVADTNVDGNVDIQDATQIQKYLAQLIPSLG